MRILPLALGGLCLLGAARPARAQNTDVAPGPKFFVGLGAYSGYYQKLGGQFQGTTGFPIPLQLTAGYQVRPRVALRLGVAYSGSSSSYSSEGYLYSNPGTPPTYFQYQQRSTRRNTSVALLARYTLTRNLAHRMQFDALAGFGFEHGSGYVRGTRADSLTGRLQTTPYTYHGTQNAFVLTFGGAARYRLTPRFELTFDVTASHTVPITSPANRIQGLTTSTALGLRYRFGQR